MLTPTVILSTTTATDVGRAATYANSPTILRIMYLFMHHPGSGLSAFGMLLVLFSLLGARQITVPVLKIDIELQTDKWVRHAAFILGTVCIITGVVLFRFLPQ